MILDILVYSYGYFHDFMLFGSILWNGSGSFKWKQVKINNIKHHSLKNWELMDGYWLDYLFPEKTTLGQNRQKKYSPMSNLPLHFSEMDREDYLIYQGDRGVQKWREGGGGRNPILGKSLSDFQIFQNRK